LGGFSIEIGAGDAGMSALRAQ